MNALALTILDQPNESITTGNFENVMFSTYLVKITIPINNNQ